MISPFSSNLLALYQSVDQATFLLEVLGDNGLLHLFQLLVVAFIPWLVAFPSIFKASRLPCSNISLTLMFMPLPLIETLENIIDPFR